MSRATGQRRKSSRLFDRLLLHRYRGGPNRTAQALYVHRHLPDIEVCHRRTAREGSDSHFQRVSAALDRLSPTRSTPFAPTTAASSPRQALAVGPFHSSRRRLQMARYSELMPSNTPAPRTISDIEPQSQSIPGPTARSNAMNRTIKDATVKRFHYGHEHLRRHLPTSSRPTSLAAGSRPQRPHALRVHLQGMGFPARTAGTKN